MSEELSRRRSRVREEHYHRDGVWIRELHPRCEPWPVIEQWATDRGFHLSALRGKRRLYTQGEKTSLYQVVLDIRERDDGRGVLIHAWIQASWLARFLHAFRHGSVLKIEPSGWAGVWVRRAACRDFNDLLQRFRQIPIAGTETWHLADIDPSTLALTASLFLPVGLMLAYDGAQLEVGAALSNGLLASLAHRLAPLFWVAPVVIGLHHFLAVKRLRTLLAKAASLGVGFLVFAVLTLVLMTRTASEMALQKVSYHCLYRFDERACAEALRALPPKERVRLGAQIPRFEGALSRVAPPSGPRPR